jgi:radical SAM superfamily enzyme YgiQ (UPF0313 family)
MDIALVNTNTMRPPIAPIGLDYVAEALGAAGHRVEVLDLCWADDQGAAVASFFEVLEADLVGVTLRNTDDCIFTTRQSFLDAFADTVAILRKHTDAPVVLGGVGFSAMPEAVLDLSGADAGIWGDGELAFTDLADAVSRSEEWTHVPNLIWRSDGSWRRNPPAKRPLSDLPEMRRRWIDNPRYFREGGQAGFETKRGCPAGCVYCADPVTKGSATRLRPPHAVADEIAHLLDQGIDHLHTCDSEFNLPAPHAAEVCDEIVRRALGERLRWYAYCAPGPFSRDLALLMRRAGCVGVNFGADNGDADMLRRLKRGFGPDDIASAVRACREAGIAVMLDLLLGSPGETRESIVRTVELMKRIDPDRVGVSLGIRIYPGTALADRVATGELEAGLVGGGDLCDPLFFVEPEISSCAPQLLSDLIGKDERFFFTDPDQPETNYNYNANQRLVEAIAQGHRGAYWDILRRYA